MREKVGKSRNTVFFQWFVAPEGRKVGSLKRRVRSQLARWEMKNCTPLWREAHFEVKMYKTHQFGPLLEVEMSKKCTPLWREAHFEVKMYKTHQVRTTFGSWDVEKVHAVVARSTFRSQNVQNTPFRSRTTFGSWDVEKVHAVVARSTFRSQNVQNKGFGPLLEVQMSKKCTPLWREAHFEVKMYKTHHVRTTFGGSDVEKVHAVVARSTFRSQNVQNTTLAPLLEVQMSKKCTPLWREAHFEVKMYKTLGVRTTFGGSDVASPLRFTTLHYVTLHHTPLYYTTLHYTTLHNTTTTTTQLDYTPLHSTTLNFTTLHYTTLRSTTLHYIKLHYTPLHYITLHYAPQHYNYNYTTTLHYTPLH